MGVVETDDLGAAVAGSPERLEHGARVDLEPAPAIAKPDVVCRANAFDDDVFIRDAAQQDSATFVRHRRRG